MLRTKQCGVLALVSACLFVLNEANAQFIFGTPEKLPAPTNTDDTSNGAPSVSADGLTIYWVRDVLENGGVSSADIWSATRASTSDPWGNPMRLGEGVNTEAFEGFPSVSSDGLSLYFSRSQIGYDGTPSTAISGQVLGLRHLMHGGRR